MTDGSSIGFLSIGGRTDAVAHAARLGITDLLAVRQFDSGRIVSCASTPQRNPAPAPFKDHPADRCDG
jgi:hypothetical protein